MKRRIPALLSLILCVVCGASLSACTLQSLDNTDNSTHTTHSYETTWSYDGTCHWQACSGCDEVRNRAEHDWNSGIVTIAPTTTTEGVKTYTCNTCGKTKVETIPVTGTHTHVYDQQVVSDSYLISAATCMDKAVYYYSCSCGERGSETFESGEALGHSFTNYIYNDDSTCTTDGTKTAKCDRCEETSTAMMRITGSVISPITRYSRNGWTQLSNPSITAMSQII